jgi:hypothetical protein
MSEYEVSRYLSKIGSKGGTKSASLKTPAERSALARKASLSRRKIKKKPGPWFKVVLYPEVEWQGVQHAARMLDEMANHMPPVFWTQDRQEARKVVKEWADRGRAAEIYEECWSPTGAFQPVFESKPDPKRAVAGLKAVLP